MTTGPIATPASDNDQKLHEPSEVKPEVGASNTHYNIKWYVVYDGHDHADGVYESWDDTPDAAGAAGIVRGYRNAVFKSFSSLEAAKNHHREAQETGVIEVLQQEVECNKIYTVTKGVKPGVYKKR